MGNQRLAPQATASKARAMPEARPLPGACLVGGMWSAPGRDEEKAGVEDGDDCE